MEPLIIIFGFVISVVLITNLSSIIKAWIKRNGSNIEQEKFDRLAKAFIKYKRDNEHRMEKLEAVIHKDNQPEPAPSENQPMSNRSAHKSIEIEPERTGMKKQTGTRSGRMENMLRE